MVLIKVIIWVLLGYLVADIFKKPSRRQVNLEPVNLEQVKFEDTELGTKVIHYIQEVIDGCNTAEDAQVKVWDICECWSDDYFSGIRQMTIEYLSKSLV